MIYEHLTFVLVPARVGAFREALERQVLPARELIFGRPFGVFVTEIGTLNEITIITTCADQEDYEGKQATLLTSKAWRNFEVNVRDAIVTRSNKLMNATQFMTTSLAKA